jgi:hypothetical protein
MAKSQPDYRTDVWIKIAPGERNEGLCSIIRSLLHANANSDGQATTNAQFRKGALISFGASTKADDFMESVKFFVKKKVRERISMEKRG